jgi:transcription initiation factor TFIIIB Brf1 subunit/transcription initiation factor TFIIB
MKTKCPFCGASRFIGCNSVKSVKIVCKKCKHIIGSVRRYKPVLSRMLAADDKP